MVNSWRLSRFVEVNIMCRLLDVVRENTNPVGQPAGLFVPEQSGRVFSALAKKNRGCEGYKLAPGRIHQRDEQQFLRSLRSNSLPYWCGAPRTASAPSSINKNMFFFLV